MPSLKNNDDRITLEAIERWRDEATASIDDIGVWRARSDREREYRNEWPQVNGSFHRDTTWLVCWIVARHHLDTKPIQDVYQFVEAWHTNHHAKRIPPMDVLVATLDRAMTVVQAVEFDIRKRIDECTKNAPADSAVKPTATPADGAMSNEAKALGLLAEHPDWTDKRIAETVGVNRGTLNRWPKYKAARDVLRAGGKDHRWDVQRRQACNDDE